VPVRNDAWLTDVLQRPVYAVDPVFDAADHGPGLYFAKIPVADPTPLRALTAQGFVVVDVNVTYAHAREVEPREAEIGVEPARPEHHDALAEIAGSCFRYSRFHLDPEIPDELADRVKSEWLRSYGRGDRGVELLAALDDGRPVGFLAVLADRDKRVIDLIGVARGSQGRGVGTALVSAFVARHGPGASALRVGTQIANGPSIRLYERCGFAFAGAAYVLHLHRR